MKAFLFVCCLMAVLPFEMSRIDLSIEAEARAARDSVLRCAVLRGQSRSGSFTDCNRGSQEVALSSETAASLQAELSSQVSESIALAIDSCCFSHSYARNTHFEQHSFRGFHLLLPIDYKCKLDAALHYKDDFRAQLAQSSSSAESPQPHDRTDPACV